jgi:hypothetical protein
VAQKFKSGISLEELASAASAAVGVSVDGDTNARIQIDAGGKVTWGSGAATGDVNLYRDAADALKTDDTLEAAAGLITSTSAGAPTATIADGALAVDTTNDAFYFRSGSSWNQVTGGGGSSSITTSDTAPISPSDGDLWYETDTGRTLVYYADGTSSQWVEVGASASVTSRLVLQDDDADTKVQVEEGTDDDTIRFDTLGVERMVIKSDGKVGIGTTTPATTLDVAGDLSVEGVTVTDATNAFLTLNDSGGTVGTNTSSRVTFQAGGGTAGQIGYLGTGSGIMSIRNYDGPMYIQTDSVDPIIFKTTATEQVRITDAGKVGIGTTTPQAPLSFANSTGNKIDFYHTTTGSGDRYGIQVQANELRIHAGAGGVSTGGITFGSSTTGTFTERMRITNAGKVGIGTTSPDYDLHIHNSATYGRIKVSGSSTGYTQADILLECSGGNRGAGIYMFNSYHDKTWYAGMPYTSTDRYILGRTSNAAMQQSTAAVGSGLFQFYSNGAAYNTTGTWGSTSDIRMKGEVETARSYLADLNQLRVVTYRFTKDQHIDEDTGLEFLDREEPSEKMLGLIAQEVEEIFPALVTDGTDEAMVLKQSVLVPMLLTAVQELSARIETLETA